MTNNILSITFGAFKMDVPLDGIKKMAKSAERKQKTASGIVKRIETKEAMPTATLVVSTKTARVRGPNVAYGAYKSFSAYLQQAVLKIPVGESLFITHPDSKRARYIAHDASRILRNKGSHNVISVRQVIESGVSGIRIYRLR